MSDELRLGDFLRRIGPNNIKEYAVERLADKKYGIAVWTRRGLKIMAPTRYSTIDEAQKAYGAQKKYAVLAGKYHKRLGTKSLSHEKAGALTHRKRNNK